MLNKKIFGFLTLVLFAVFSSSAAGYAEDISVSATVNPKTVSLGQILQLTITVAGIQNASAPDIDLGDNFQVRDKKSSREVSIVNGQMTSSVSHIYSLMALKEGRHTIPAVKIEIKGKTYSTQPVIVEVIKGALPRKQTSSGSGGSDDAAILDDLIFLEISSDKKEAYINEEIPVNIRLYFRQVSVRDINYPQFATEGFYKGKFREPYQSQAAVDGLMYNLIDFKTVIYPVAVGQLTLGPAELKCNMLIPVKRRRRSGGLFDDNFFGGFFNRQQVKPLTLKSEPLSITVKPLPQANKPAGFSGGVGQYNFELEVNPKKVQVGDPLNLTMKITGRGNIQTVSAPEIKGLDKFKIYDPQIKTELNKNQIYIQGQKIFEQVLIPTQLLGEDSAIQAVSFSYFDPDPGQYRTITRGPVSITVTPGTEDGPARLIVLPTEEQKSSIEDKAARGIVYIKTAPLEFKQKGRYLYKNPLFIIINILPFFTFILAVIYQKRKDRLTYDLSYARRQRARLQAKKGLKQAKGFIKNNKHEQALNIVFKVMQEYLGDRFNLASAGITHQVIEDLPKDIIPKPTQADIRNFFQICDAARFAPQAEIKEDLAKVMDMADKIIKTLEKIKD